MLHRPRCALLLRPGGGDQALAAAANRNVPTLSGPQTPSPSPAARPGPFLPREEAAEPAGEPFADIGETFAGVGGAPAGRGKAVAGRGGTLTDVGERSGSTGGTSVGAPGGGKAEAATFPRARPKSQSARLWTAGSSGPRGEGPASRRAASAYRDLRSSRVEFLPVIPGIGSAEWICRCAGGRAPPLTSGSA